jgi:Kyanoviridae head maturation protease
MSIGDAKTNMTKKFHFLRETVEGARLITETSADGGQKRVYMQGIFMQSGIKNRNGRRYPTGVLQNEAARYTESYITKNRAWGELGHPNSPTINPDRICLLIKEMKQDAGNFIGKALVTDTPMGKILEGLMGDGGDGSVGVSSRAMGTLKEASDGVQEVQDDLKLSAIDAVIDPSAPDAWMSAIHESRSWVYDESIGWRVCEAAEDARRILTKSSPSSAEIVEAFENWLDGVRYNQFFTEAKQSISKADSEDLDKTFVRQFHKFANNTISDWKKGDRKGARRWFDQVLRVYYNHKQVKPDSE